jgi:heme A synthase
MIMIESSVGNNNIFLQLVGELTLIILIIALSAFSFLVFRSRSNIKTFQSQMMLFIVLYLVGGIIENINIFPSFPELGSQIHVVATVFLTVLFWARFRNSKKYEIQMIDDDIDKGAKQ